jgi:hypothetical protein
MMNRKLVYSISVGFQKEQYAVGRNKKKPFICRFHRTWHRATKEEDYILCENSYVYMCLYKRFLQKSSERVPINVIILRVQAVQINKLFDGDMTFKASEGWLWMWKVPYVIYKINTKAESASGDSIATEHFPETLCKLTVYFWTVVQLRWNNTTLNHYI